MSFQHNFDDPEHLDEGIVRYGLKIVIFGINKPLSFFIDKYYELKSNCRLQSLVVDVSFDAAKNSV